MAATLLLHGAHHATHHATHHHITINVSQNQATTSGNLRGRRYTCAEKISLFCWMAGSISLFFTSFFAVLNTGMNCYSHPDPEAVCYTTDLIVSGVVGGVSCCAGCIIEGCKE